MLDILLISAYPPYPRYVPERTLLHYLSIDSFPKDMIFFHDEMEFVEIPRYKRNYRLLRPIPAPENYPPREKFPSKAKEASSAQMWQTIHDLTTSRNYDIVHLIGGLELAEYYPLVKSLPTVITPLFSRTQPAQEIFEKEKNWFKKRTLKRQFLEIQKYESWIYRDFGAVIAATPEEQKALQTTDPEAKVTRLPLGVDLDYYDPTGYDPEKAGILFIGDFTNPIDLQAAFTLCREIFPSVRRQLPEAHLFIVGANPPLELRDFSSKFVSITGHAHDLRPFFEMASVYVCPLPAYGGFRIDVLRAMAMITPVVATQIACTGLDEFRPNRDLIVGKNKEEMVTAIVRLVQDQHLRQRIQENARLLVEDFYSWQAVVKQYHTIYNSLVR